MPPTLRVWLSAADAYVMHLILTRAISRWWNKPLAMWKGRELPAELIVLEQIVGASERGAWINSRGTKSAVVDFKRESQRFSTVRERLPVAVSAMLANYYAETGLRKGLPDLVVWNSLGDPVRFVEVKCPVWDRPSQEQMQAIMYFASRGMNVDVVEWEFQDHV